MYNVIRSYKLKMRSQFLDELAGESLAFFKEYCPSIRRTLLFYSDELDRCDILALTSLVIRLITLELFARPTEEEAQEISKIIISFAETFATSLCYDYRMDGIY